ncbi:MAG: hypothetical protein WDW38_003575 [Sanguina aurantia]
MAKEEVQDRFGIVYMIFVLLGTATLLPWNVFLTEKEFYDVRFQVAPFNEYIADNFMSLFALVFNTTNLLALGVLIQFQRYLSLRVLVAQPLLITFIMLVATAGVAVKVSISGEQMAQFTLPSLGLMGVCTAMLQGGARYSLPASSQQCTSGVWCQASHSGTGVPSAEDVAPAALVYFGASAGVLLLCIIGYSLLPYLPYGRYKLLLAGIIDDPKERDLLTTAEDYIEPLLTITNSTPAPAAAAAAAAEPDPSQLLASTSTSPLLPTHHAAASPAGGVQQQQQQQQRTSTRTAIVSVESDHSLFTRSWQRRNAFTIYCVALFNCLAVTMSSHPGISSFICSVNNPALTSPCTSRLGQGPLGGRLFGDLFVPLLYVMFSVGDFLGRLMSGYGPWARAAPKPLSILFYSVVRAGITAAVLFCHLVTPTSWTLPQLLGQDYYPLGLIMLLGLTQGHLISTICMHAPATLQPAHASRYGPVTSFAISSGCFLGSFVSLYLATQFQTHVAGPGGGGGGGPAGGGLVLLRGLGGGNVDMAAM